MKREDQKRNKDLQKNLSVILKECPLKYKEEKLKKIDYMLWLTRKNMIFEFFPRVCIRENDLKPILSIRISYKPLWADDLLWDILGMESNKQEPNSLRVIGAFTAVSARYDDYLIELQAEDIDSVKAILFEKIEDFLKKVDEVDESQYVNQIIGSDLIRDMDKALVYIYLQRIEEAKSIIISSKDSGRFVIGEKNYRELMLEYLVRMG